MIDGNGLRIIIVCTFGAGSSQLLKMNVDDVIRELGVENITTETCDLGTFGGQKCDGVITTSAHADMAKGNLTAKSYVVIKGIFNLADIKEKTTKLLLDLGVKLK